MSYEADARRRRHASLSARGLCRFHAHATRTDRTPQRRHPIEADLTPVVSAPSNCVTKVKWDASGVAVVEHILELDTGNGLGVRVSPDKPPRTSTVNRNPGTFTTRTVTGGVKVTLYDRKGTVLANTDWVDAGFTCTGG